ncbi:Csu type fimbrial protein [Cupriavidus sp. H39]|uniref:Csu type fimbrial protein n=1 Tax=Cupriavidus sp. H39 TaxID=3401635 RepID=UPI003D04798B
MRNIFERAARAAGFVLVLLVLLTEAGHAACSVTGAVPATFGSVTSFVVRNASQSTSTTNAGLSCGGALLSVLGSGDHVYATIQSANATKLVASNGDTIPYAIFADSGYTVRLNAGQQYDFASGQGLNILGLLGGPGGYLPLYFRTITGSNVAAGVYTDTLTINWQWNYCSGIGLLGLCLGRDVGSGTSTVTLTLTVTNDCVVTAPNIDFGSAPLVGAFQAINSNISLVCTKGMSYTVGIGPGMNVASDGRRQMASGSYRLQYDLFNSGNPAAWDATANRVASSGLSDGLTAQSLPYTAKIYADQATPPVGAYTDSVIIDIRY